MPDICWTSKETFSFHGTLHVLMYYYKGYDFDVTTVHDEVIINGFKAR